MSNKDKIMDITPLLEELYTLQFKDLIVRLKDPNILDFIKAKFVAYSQNIHDNQTAIKIATAVLIDRFRSKVLRNIDGEHERAVYREAIRLVDMLKANPTIPGLHIDAYDYLDAFESWKVYDLEVQVTRLKHDIINLLDLFFQEDLESKKEILRMVINTCLEKLKKLIGHQKLLQFWNIASIDDYNTRYGLNVPFP